jgi:hypothetical protein
VPGRLVGHRVLAPGVPNVDPERFGFSYQLLDLSD